MTRIWGLLNVDLKARDSLTLGLTEAARPAVDASVLDLLGSRVSTKGDVFEMRQGSGRLLPALTNRLAEMTQSRARTVLPCAG